MEFTTKRLTIGAMAEDDLEQILDLLTNDTVGKTYMLPAYSYRAEAEPLARRLVQLSAQETRYVAGIYWNQTWIGIINATEIKDGQIELGYALLPGYYNRGFATEALGGAIRFLLAEGFSTVRTGAFAENAASLRVMQKCGMRLQPHTDEIEYRGQMHHCVYYAATAEDL